MSAWGVLASGGGHFIPPIMLFISPVFAGILCWPLWGWLAADFRSGLSKGLFIVTMFAHFADTGVAVFMEHDSEWFPVGVYNPIFLVAKRPLRGRSDIPLAQVLSLLVS